MLIWLESRIEWARIWLAQVRERQRRLGELVEWVNAQWSVAIVAGLITVIATYLDVVVLATPNDPQATGLRDALPPTLALAGAGYTLLISTWFVVTQFAGNRYQSAAVVARLATDWSSALVLRLFVVTIIVGLYALAASQLGVVPRALGVVAMLLLGIALLAVLSYRVYGLVLFQPSALARMIRQQSEQRIREVARSSRLSRSVANHMQVMVRSDWQVWQELLTATAGRDEVGHREIAEQLAGMLMTYLDEWPGIPRDSAWFPRTQIPVSLNDRSFGAKQLRHIFENQALGSPWQTGAAVTWFQDDVLRVLRRAAADEGKPYANLHILGVIGELLLFAWQRQEIVLLERLERDWAHAREKLRLAQRDGWLASVENQLLRFLDEVQRRRFDLDERFPLTEYPDEPSLRRTPTPAIVRAELLAAALALSTEQHLASHTVTRLDALSRELVTRLREREAKEVDTHGTWAFAQLAALLKLTVDGNAHDATCEVARTLCLIAQRAWTLKTPSLAAAAIDVLLPILPSVKTAVVSVPYEERRDLQQQSRVLALDTIVANRGRAADCIAIAIQIASTSADDLTRESDTSRGMSPPLETAVVVGGLAFAVGEIRDDHTLVERVIEDLRASGWNLTALAALAEVFDSPSSNLYGPGQGLTLEYHRYVSPLYEEVGQFGEEFVDGGQYGIGHTRPKTKSEWLQRHASLLGFSVSDAVVGFLRYLGEKVSPAQPGAK